MNISQTVCRLITLPLAAGLLLADGCAHAASRPPAPPAPRFAALNAAANSPATATPAFLDAADQVTIWVDQATTPAALTNHISVRCGAETIPVTQIAVVDGDAAKLAGVESSAAADKSEVTLAGTFQSALGGSDWSTDDPRTRMREVAPGVYRLQVTLPQGSYEYKVVRGGTWAINYGSGLQPNGDNIPLQVPLDNTRIVFQVDFNKSVIRTSLDDPDLAPDSSAAPPPQTESSANVFRLTLARALTPGDITRPMLLRITGEPPRPIYARDVLSDPEYYYAANDLGATYTPAATTFKVWSPISTSADLLLYRDAAQPACRTVPLRRATDGVWSAVVPGNLNGVYYQYRFTSYGVQRTAPDIYGRAASSNLQRTMVVDLSRTDPPGWSTVPAPHLAQPTDAVVYEAHIRDFTVDPSSGVPANLRGKYLGVVAPSTTVPVSAGAPTGLSYLQQLGITDLHLLPFQSIAQHRTPGYNWGYETYLFDVPEPRYATDPSDPAGVIRQVKTMVAGLHRAHIGLVMDVVYNHTVPTEGDASPFWATVPYYYFRTDPKGTLYDESGVGNSVDDDHPMVRKYLIDSLTYWETQYHVDGFRFDEMGIFEPSTMRAISQTLHRLRPDVLLYGEPWSGGGPTRFGKGKQRGLQVAVFNDIFRDAVRGDLNGAKPGFALGGETSPVTLKTIISGSPNFTQAPTETMNYVSIHDDEALWDKITQTLPDNPSSDKQALKLAGAMVLLSQGVPILEGGAELGRTKQGNPNSYNAGDAINHFDWTRAQQFADVSRYYAALIALRRAHPAFRCATEQLVKQTLSFYPGANLPSAGLPNNTIAFTLNGAPTGDPWSKILVIFHGETTPATITLPRGSWHLAINGDLAQLPGDLVSTPTISLAPLSATVLYQD